MMTPIMHAGRHGARCDRRWHGMIDLRSLARLSGAQSRSISPENFGGAKGGGARATEGTGAAAAAHLGQRPHRRAQHVRAGRHRRTCAHHAHLADHAPR